MHSPQGVGPRVPCHSPEPPQHHPSYTSWQNSRKNVTSKHIYIYIHIHHYCVLKGPSFLLPPYLFNVFLRRHRRPRPAVLADANRSLPGTPSAVVRWICQAHGPPLGSRVLLDVRRDPPLCSGSGCVVLRHDSSPSVQRSVELCPSMAISVDSSWRACTSVLAFAANLAMIVCRPRPSCRLSGVSSRCPAGPQRVLFKKASHDTG